MLGVWYPLCYSQAGKNTMCISKVIYLLFFGGVRGRLFLFVSGGCDRLILFLWEWDWLFLFVLFLKRFFFIPSKVAIFFFFFPFYNSCSYFLVDVKKVIFSQIFGGLVFALYGGTPQIVLLTTAPLALYTKSKY